MDRRLRIGFVATRFAGADGVSLESEKWADELRAMGHEVAYFGGVVERPAASSRVVEEAFFGHEGVLAINEAVFGASGGRPAAIGRRIDELTAHLLDALRSFVVDFELDLLVPENALAIPMHLPLGLAITRLAAESGMPVLAHHHDLPWERQRFAVSSATDLIDAAFPPRLPNVRHVCINSWQQEEISRRLGRPARIIPNVMDFEHPPAEGRDARTDVRADLGFDEDELFVLQPVRVIPRKGIEHAVELVARLDRPARLVISHETGDEGMAYAERIARFAELLGVRIVWAADRLASGPGVGADGQRTHPLGDFYRAADLMMYPSLIEGFGNAFLEGVYHRVPILVNRYLVYDRDIRPKGFRCVEIDGFVTDDAVEAVRALVDDPTEVAARGDANYELGRRHFSHRIVREGLTAELAELFPE